MRRLCASARPHCMVARKRDQRLVEVVHADEPAARELQVEDHVGGDGHRGREHEYVQPWELDAPPIAWPASSAAASASPNSIAKIMTGGCICVAIARVVVTSNIAFRAGSSKHGRVRRGVGRPRGRHGLVPDRDLQRVGAGELGPGGGEVRQLAVGRNAGVHGILRNCSRSAGCAAAGSRSMRRDAVPMSFVSSTMRCRRSSNLAAAPVEKVKAISTGRAARTPPRRRPRCR